MPNTYTQIHIQFVFVVKYRKALIDKSFKEELYQYISGIVKKNNHNQEEHHKKQTFREEYLAFLKIFDIEYDERYIFKEPE